MTALFSRNTLFRLQKLAERKSAKAQSADLQKAPPIEAIAEFGLRPWGVLEIQHGELLLRVRSLLRWDA